MGQNDPKSNKLIVAYLSKYYMVGEQILFSSAAKSAVGSVVELTDKIASGQVGEKRWKEITN